LRDAYPDAELLPDRLPDRDDLLRQLRMWLAGNTFAEMAVATSRDVDGLLRIHTGVLSYAFATLVEQAVVVLHQVHADSEPGLSVTVQLLPDYIRYGVMSTAARNLMADGMRHRRAANLLASDPAMSGARILLEPARDVARAVLEADPERWRGVMGSFVYERTARDLGVPDPAGE
jgi:cellulase/cellobiase CelA1